LGGCDVLGRIVVVGPSVDTPETLYESVAEDDLGKVARGYAQLNALAMEAGGGEGLAVRVAGEGGGHWDLFGSV
jgi:hypothetical protein